MTEDSYEEIDDILPPEPNGELVHWMEPRPLTVGAAGVSLTAAGAFALGVLATLAVVGLVAWRAAPGAQGLARRFGRRPD